MSALPEGVQDARAVLSAAVHVPAVPRPGVGPHGGPAGGEGDAVHALRDVAAHAQVRGRERVEDGGVLVCVYVCCFGVEA